MIEYKVVDVTVDDKDAVAVEITSGAYQGATLVYGKISVEETGEEAILHFNFDLIDEQKKYIMNDELKQFAGDLMLQLLQESIEKQTAIYHGGTDAS